MSVDNFFSTTIKDKQLKCTNTKKIWNEMKKKKNTKKYFRMKWQKYQKRDCEIYNGIWKFVFSNVIFHFSFSYLFRFRNKIRKKKTIENKQQKKRKIWKNSLWKLKGEYWDFVKKMIMKIGLNKMKCFFNMNESC